MWTLEKDPSLLRFELKSTEKFIRKHISDYSAFHHRFVVLRSMYEQQLFDSGGHLTELTELVDQYSGYRPMTTAKLVRVLLPIRYSSERDTDQWLKSPSLNTFLRTLNWIAYDLRMMNELTETFGERETFHCHRRSLLQFLYSLDLEWNKEDETRLSFSPVSKIFRRSTSAERAFEQQVRNGVGDGHEEASGTISGEEEDALIQSSHDKFFYHLFSREAERSDRHRNWCKTFLGFETGEGVDK